MVVAAALWAAVLVGAVPVGAPSAGAVAGGEQAAPGTYPFVVRVQVGTVRACSGALVDPRWVITADACLRDTGEARVIGPPRQPTTVTVGPGETDPAGALQVVEVVEVVPRPDRALALVRLRTPVTGIAPVPLATGAVRQDEVLQVVGYGRTSDAWIPARPHVASFSVGALSASTLDLAGRAPDAALCPGDAGAPVLRGGGGDVSLAGVADTAWSGGCLGSVETRRDAQAVRADDLASWIAEMTGSCTPTVEDGFTSLYDGGSAPAARWRLAGSGKVVEDGCEVVVTGQDAVWWFAADRMGAAHTLRLDWMARGRDSDSGVFVGLGHPEEPDSAAAARPVEVQIDPDGTGKSATAAVHALRAPAAEAASAVRPEGWWNTYEIVVTDQRVTVRLNGVLVNDHSAEDSRMVGKAVGGLTQAFGAGFVGLQGSPAGGEVRFRNIRVRSDVPRSRLASGQSLTGADRLLVSADGRFQFAVQPDSNLVLYERRVGALWAGATTQGTRFVNQPDGNLVLYTDAGTAVWSSGTHTAGPSTLVMQDDGNLVLYRDSDAKAVWNTRTCCHQAPPPALRKVTNSLPSGRALLRGEGVLVSADSRFRVALQVSDGNLVLSQGSSPLWSSGPLRGAAWLVNQPDGNLVVYRSDGVALWFSGTHTAGPSTLVMQDDGNLVLYRDSDGTAVWNTRTCCR